MKVWEWYLLVAIALALLITTFFTRNIYVAIGTFILVMYLKKHSNGIPLPKQFKKLNIVSAKAKKIVKAETKE